ncbi:MAG: hypothetical protein M3Q10_07440 [Chloroflexota bacterium]|nr:hypothetical protein [Chloroflexota bacterium]
MSVLALVVGVSGGWSPLAGAAAGQIEAVAAVDPGAYDAYVPTATKDGQFYSYTCEFDAAWVILKTFGHDVPFEEQLEIVGLDRGPEPYYEATADSFVVHGGDITSAFSGDYRGNMLARTTGRAMAPLFAAYGLDVEPVDTREGVQAALDGGALVWIKATVDFLPWEPVTWITPEGEEIETVLGNDHAVVVAGYDEEVVVIRDVLGPTSSNWERPYQYEVPWDTFLAVWAAQQYDGLAVAPAADVESSDDATDTAPEDGNGVPGIRPPDGDGGL